MLLRKSLSLCTYFRAHHFKRSIILARPLSTRICEWNRAVTEAEKVVGYPTSMLNLRYFLSEDFSSCVLSLRKLIGSQHPLVKTIKNLIYDGCSNIQTWGLVILLLSKSVGHSPSSVDSDEASRSGFISSRQRSLAEITEMIHTAYLVHKGLLNLEKSAVVNTPELESLALGNKVSVVCGDYLLAVACKELAKLRNINVVDNMATAIGDFSESAFLGAQDNCGHSFPSGMMGFKTWENWAYLSTASLMGHGCKSTMVLAGHNESLQRQAFEFGVNVGLAWQAYSDLQPFESTSFQPFDLFSAPVVFHLEKDVATFDYIKSCHNIEEELDLEKLKKVILEGSGVKQTKEILAKYIDASLSNLSFVKDSEGKSHLISLVSVLGENIFGNKQ